METSRLGLLFIAKAEACVLTAYQDGEHMSIGFGHNDPDLKEGDKITVKQAFALLKSDVKKREPELNRILKFKNIPQHEYDALMSLLFNRGVKATKEVFESKNFKTWGVNKAGRAMPGIQRRRNAEQIIHDRAEYGDIGSILLWHGNPRTTQAENYLVTEEDL